ncbi:unnamed protein product [Gadus morhua 'NCC']
MRANHHLPPPSVPQTNSSSNPLGKERRGATRGALSSPTLQPQSVSPCKCTKSPLLFKPETRLANGAGNTAVALPELLVYRASFQSRTTSVGSREDINPRAFVTETPLDAKLRSWKSSPFLRAVGDYEKLIPVRIG